MQLSDTWETAVKPDCAGVGRAACYARRSLDAGLQLASRDIFSALVIPDFRWLWIGSLGSSFAMNMQIIARGWLVYTLTSSPLDLGWVTISFMLPTVLFALWGGVLADRLPKRRVIVLAQLLNAVATLIMALIIFTDRVNFWHFIWFGFFNGSILALSMPARQAFVPELIPERLIFTAMALTTTSWNLSRIVGPALAGLLIAYFADGDTSSTYGVGILYFVIAALYLISGITMLGVSKPGVPQPPDGKSPWTDVADALRYVWAHPPVFGLIMLGVVPFLFGMTVNTMLPAFNQDVLGGGPEDLGYLVSAMGLGAIVGSLMLATMGGMRRKAMWLLVSAFAWAGLTLLFGFTTTTLAALAVMAMTGWVSAWNMSLNRGLLQLQVEDHMRGRILSIDMMSHGLMPLGLIPISYIAESTSVATGIVASGCAFLLAVMLLVLITPSIRRVDEGL